MADSVFTILQRKYPVTQYALMAEVSDAAGFNRSRSADFVAVGLWPSRGLAIEGFELKSYRSDWLGELKKPEKAENIFQYCDMFWLLTTDETIAKIEEIPATWGWMCIKGNKIFIKKQAPKLTPKPCSKNFIATMLKRANDKTQYVHVESIEDKINEAYERGKKEAERSNSYTESRNKDLTRIIDEFEETSGIQLRHNFYDAPKKIGTALKLLVDLGETSVIDSLNRIKEQNEKTNKKIETALLELQENKIEIKARQNQIDQPNLKEI